MKALHTFMAQVTGRDEYGLCISVREHEEAVAELEAKFSDHTKAVGRFLYDLYATMVDPVEECNLKVGELCELLLKTATEDRERLAGLPAIWQQDSSLETWFPLTAEEMKRDKGRIATLTARVKELEATVQRLSAPVKWVEFVERRESMSPDGIYEHHYADVAARVRVGRTWGSKGVRQRVRALARQETRLHVRQLRAA